MKTRYKILIVTAIIILAFYIWSSVDTVCYNPCVLPPDAPDNVRCTQDCQDTPRWYVWFR